MYTSSVLSISIWNMKISAFLPFDPFALFLLEKCNLYDITKKSSLFKSKIILEAIVLSFEIGSNHTGLQNKNSTAHGIK